MMRVLSVIHYPVFGGPHNRNLRLAPVLAAEGVHTTVLLPDEPGSAAGRLRAAGVDVITMPLRRLRATPSPRMQARLVSGFWREVWAIRRLIRERDIDLVQINGLVNPHGAIAARLEGVPVIWQLLDTRPPMIFRRVMMPLVTRLADVVMSTGRAVASVHPGAEALGERLHVFFPPVDPTAFVPGVVDRGAVRVEFGLAPEDLVVGVVGNLNPQKGHEYLIRAAAVVQARQANVKVLVVGASYDTHREYERRLRRLSRDLGLVTGRDIAFAGPRADVRPALSAMDVFVLSSVPRSEGAPTVVQEAMMMGLPVVATDVGAVAEVVEDGVTGYVVPPLDPQAIAEAALRMLGDPALRERMGRAGRERVVERFSVERCAQAHLQAYDHALRRRGRRGLLREEGLASLAWRQVDFVAEPGMNAADLLKLLTCPVCRDSDLLGLDERLPDGMLTCSRCGAAYRVRGGIPILLPPGFDGSHVHDELDHLRKHKQEQADYFDREVAEEFEISRPHGAPSAYQWLMAEKFRRSVELLPALRGPVVVDACCGSGMDAEFLAREGARVIALDISEGCARRARARAARHELDYVVIVGDVEHLPIRTDAADMSYVHDGLHHLAEPLVGVRELARVARRAVSINEPVDALGTRVAVRLGIAVNRESAGNRVARLRAEDVSRELQSAGFEPRARRYFMYYKHEPGSLLRFASQPVVHHVYRSMVGLVNVAIGRWGNKLQVTAVRAS